MASSSAAQKWKSGGCLFVWLAVQGIGGDHDCDEGAGLAGLAAAYDPTKNRIVTIVEKSTIDFPAGAVDPFDVVVDVLEPRGVSEVLLESPRGSCRQNVRVLVMREKTHVRPDRVFPACQPG